MSERSDNGCRYCGEEVKEPGHLGKCNVYQREAKEVILTEAFNDARVIFGLIRNNFGSDFSKEVEFWLRKYVPDAD